MSLFSAFPLAPVLVQRLAAGNIVAPTPIQDAALPALLSGRDLIGQARTGSGKTLAFLLPIVQRTDPARAGVQALVLAPTRELVVQIGAVLGQLTGPGGRLRTALLYGGKALGPQAQALGRGVHIVIATPGRLLDHLGQGNINLATLRMLVLDEADEMLDRGFGPAVERILAQTPPRRQTALFSATMPDWIQKTAARHLRNPVTVMVDPAPEHKPEIDQVIYEVQEGAKPRVLRALLDRQTEGSTIVFGRTKHHVKRLALQLQAEGYPAAALQGNMSQNARERVIEDFRAGPVAVLLATNVAARGLDLTDVAQVINYELPESAEWFTHRAGRTGRMGRTGTAVTLLAPDDLVQWRQIERSLGVRLPRQAWAAETPPVAAVVRTPPSAPAPPNPAKPARRRRRPQPSRALAPAR